MTGLFAGVLPPAFERHVLILPAGVTRPVGESVYRDALVEVAQGEIELSFRYGLRFRFGHGEVLWLDGLPRGGVLRSRGPQSAVLVAVRRRPR